MLYSKTKIGDELEKAADEWGKMMQQAMDERFGVDKCGFFLVLTTAGKGGSMHVKTNLKPEGLIPMLRELATKLAGRVVTVH